MPSPSSADIDQLTLELVNSLKLDDVEFVRTLAERNDAPDESDGTVGYKANFDMSVEIDEARTTVRASTKVGIELEFGTVEVEVALSYSSKEGAINEIDDAVMENFVNRVAFMAAFPYLRAEVSHLTAKVFGSPLNMPIVTQGDVTSSQTD